MDMRSRILQLRDEAQARLCELQSEETRLRGLINGFDEFLGVGGPLKEATAFNLSPATSRMTEPPTACESETAGVRSQRTRQPGELAKFIFQAFLWSTKDTLSIDELVRRAQESNVSARQGDLRKAIISTVSRDHRIEGAGPRGHYRLKSEWAEKRQPLTASGQTHETRCPDLAGDVSCGSDLHSATDDI